MINDNKLKTILVWDLSIRFFHWLLVALVALAWATGEAEGSLFLVHKLAGYGVLAAILFRLIWGFVGGEHARFRDFIHSWSVVYGYAKGLVTLRPTPSVGHNPLGGWIIVLLLVTLIGVAGTGLFAFEDEVAGPLASSISPGTGHDLEHPGSRPARGGVLPGPLWSSSPAQYAACACRNPQRSCTARPRDPPRGGKARHYPTQRPAGPQRGDVGTGAYPGRESGARHQKPADGHPQ